MPKRLAVAGDNTTHGKIISASSNYFSGHQQVAQNNDSAICFVCKGTFPIQGTAQGMISHQHLLVQDQDRVLCHCPNHYVIASAQLFTS